MSLSAKPPEDAHVLKPALSAVFNWSYSGELDELRNLYAKGLDMQWIAMRDLPWQDGIDRDAFTSSFSMAGIPVDETALWQRLSDKTRWEVARRGSAFMLSQFLHGEQGALLVASQLVNAVPHLDGKFYAATQTLDEARHVEVFARYIRVLDEIHPISGPLGDLLDSTLSVDDWMHKCVGMQIVVEGLALFVFRDMRDTTREPLLKQLLTYVSRDEARHTAYGIKYLSAVVPTLSDAERARLEDFAFEASAKLLDSRRGATINSVLLQIWADAGVDPATVIAGIQDERDKLRAALERRGGRLGPISGFTVPTLKKIGLYSDRIAGHFHQLFEDMDIRTTTADGRRVNALDAVAELPDDLEAWVLQGA